MPSIDGQSFFPPITNPENTKESKMYGLAIITVSYDSQISLARLAESLELQTIKPWIWLIVDNAPISNPVLKLNTTFPTYILSGMEGNGFGSGCNTGLEYLSEIKFMGWTWLLNPDTSLSLNTHIENLLSTIGKLGSHTLLGTAIKGANHQLEQSAGWIRKGLNYRKSQISKEYLTLGDQHIVGVDWISGCNLLFQPSSFSATLRFDRYFPLYFEDIDFCLRARSYGGVCIWLNSLSVTHQKSTGSRCSSFRRERLKAISQVRFIHRYQPYWVAIAHIFRITILSTLRIPFQFSSSCGSLYGVLQALSRATF